MLTGGAYDPEIAALTLERAIDKKLGRYSTPEMRAHLNVKGLAELDLLVHGGFNAYRYNTSGGQLSLEDIADRGAGYYASHAQRAIFDRVWFFHSLDPADGVRTMIDAPQRERERSEEDMRLGTIGDAFSATLRPVGGGEAVQAVLYSPGNGGGLELRGDTRDGEYDLEVRGGSGALC